MRMIRLYSDAAVNGDPGQAGIGLLILFDHKEQEQHAIPLKGEQWNNHLAEFHALLEGLRLLIAEGNNNQMTFCYTDSQILAEAVEKSYVKDSDFNDYLQKILALMEEFPYISVQWIPNRENKGADNLARQALRRIKKE